MPVCTDQKLTPTCRFKPGGLPTTLLTWMLPLYKMTDESLCGHGRLTLIRYLTLGATACWRSHCDASQTVIDKAMQRPWQSRYVCDRLSTLLLRLTSWHPDR
jgi:hypothetical protein